MLLLIYVALLSLYEVFHFPFEPIHLPSFVIWIHPARGTIHVPNHQPALRTGGGIPESRTHHQRVTQAARPLDHRRQPIMAAAPPAFTGAQALSAPSVYVSLTYDPLSASDALSRVRSPQAGAVVLFAGTYAPRTPPPTNITHPLMLK